MFAERASPPDQVTRLPKVAGRRDLKAGFVIIVAGRVLAPRFGRTLENDRCGSIRDWRAEPCGRSEVGQLLLRVRPGPKEKRARVVTPRSYRSAFGSPDLSGEAC